MGWPRAPAPAPGCCHLVLGMAEALACRHRRWVCHALSARGKPARIAAAPQPWGLQTREVGSAPHAPSLLTCALGADPTADVYSNHPWV
jgi:hypothetical protein